MTFYEPSDHRQQIEILRRFSAEILNDRESQSYAPYKNTHEIEDTLMFLFFSHRGISDIALYFGAPEFVIMEKILSMRLYERYEELSQQVRNKQRALYLEPCDHLFVPQNQHDEAVRALRKSTPMYLLAQNEWTDEMSNMVYWLFRMGEDITDIALRLGCPEWAIVQQFLDDQLYFSWEDTPWFRYSSQECLDNYLNGCYF